MKRIRNFVFDEKGATAIEYGLIAALVSAAIIGGATAIGSGISQDFQTIAVKIER